jgi:hypothetical protein
MSLDIFGHVIGPLAGLLMSAASSSGGPVGLSNWIPLGNVAYTVESNSSGSYPGPGPVIGDYPWHSVTILPNQVLPFPEVYPTCGVPSPGPTVQRVLAELDGEKLQNEGLPPGCAEALEAAALAVPSVLVTVQGGGAEEAAQFLAVSRQSVVRLARRIGVLEQALAAVRLLEERPELAQQIAFLARVHAASLEGLARKEPPDREIVNDRE